MADAIRQPEHRSEPVLQAIAQVLRAFGPNLRECRIDRPQETSGFSGALVLRVCREDQAWCLRRWPRTGLTRPRLTALHHLLYDLGASGIGVLPMPCIAGTGQTLVEHNGWLWQLEPWMPGRADFHQRPSEERLRSAVQTLAQIHRAAERYECPPAGLQWFNRQASAPSSACCERLQSVGAWNAARCQTVRGQLMAKAPAEFRRPALEILRCFPIACGPVEQELLTLHDVPLPVHPCLRDIWHNHLLFTGEEVTGVVDPSASRTENVASDLSRLLGSLLGDDRTRWERALAWYHDVRPLSLDERRLILALDRSSVLLSGLTWIDRCLQGQLAEEDLPRVLPRLEAIRRRLAALAASVAP
jgi:Ser/Thr protein kinase RdoA (MazF antagonist)